MNRKLLILVTISVLVGGTAIFIKNIESELPAGTIEISNKVNGKYLVVDDKTGYVVQGQDNAKSFCWLPIPQPDETTAFQYVCSGKYHNHYFSKYTKIIKKHLLFNLLLTLSIIRSIYSFYGRKDE